MIVTLIKDIFMYYARFPQREAALQMFTNGRSDLPEYAEWMQEINALPDVSLCPEIKNYVLGVDKEAVTSRIRSFSDCFLFVDYGQIENELDRIGSRRESFLIAFTVAYPSSDSNNDLAERAMKADRALDLLCTIRRQMIADEKCVPWLKNFQADHIITPWVSEEMPSYGWSAVIRRQAYDLLKGKIE